MKIQRYAIDQIGYDMPSDYGEWCKYEDVEKLEAENESLRAQLFEKNLKYKILEIFDDYKQSPIVGPLVAVQVAATTVLAEASAYIKKRGQNE